MKISRKNDREANRCVCLFHLLQQSVDTVKHEPLIELLQSLDINPQYVKLLANIYWNQQAAVRHNGEISESISIKQGVRQGYVASPHLVVL